MTKRTGFTLIELAIVLVIVGIIASMLVPTLIEAVKRGKITEARSIMFAARDEIIGYALANNHKLPPSLGNLSNPKDPWKGDIVYRKATNLGADICKTNSTSASIITSHNDTVQNIAFILQSLGPDAVQGVELKDTTNASQPGDDLLLSVTIFHLRALVCAP